SRFYADQKQIDRGLNQLSSMQGLPDPNAEVLSRIAQASMLAQGGKPDQAVQRVTPVLEPLIKQRNALAMGVADTIARLKAAQKDLNGAYEVYEAFKKADFMPSEAGLRQFDLKATKEGGETPEQLNARLEALAAKLTPDQTRMRYALMLRY